MGKSKSQATIFIKQQQQQQHPREPNNSQNTTFNITQDSTTNIGNSKAQATALIATTTKHHHQQQNTLHAHVFTRPQQPNNSHCTIHYNARQHNIYRVVRNIAHSIDNNNNNNKKKNNKNTLHIHVFIHKTTHFNITQDNTQNIGQSQKIAHPLSLCPLML